MISTPREFWRRNSPTSLVRSPLQFTSDEDRECYRQGVRTLSLVYVGIVVLMVAITALRGEWRKQDVTTKAVAGTIETPRRH